jgi:hypothetical protein
MTARRTISAARAEAFLRLPRLALIGASDDRRKFGNTIYRELRDRPDGTVLAVNPNATTVEGDPCYPDVSALPEPVDGAIVMVPAAHAAEAVESCLDAGVSRIWLFRGFGPGSVTDAALERCDDQGVEVIAGACPMMFLGHAGGMHRFHRTMRRLRGDVTATVGAER